MIRCIIIEDEPLAAKILSRYISRVPSLKLQGIFKNALLAKDWLTLNDTDLIFLDIHLPKLKGMDFLKTLSAPPAVIITTAYNQYAVEGFDLNVTDYLLKPFDFNRFLVAANKVKTLQDSRIHANESDFIFLRSERKTVKVLFSEIVYIESQREYIKIVTTEREYISRMSTKEIERLLPANIFKRIHRSYIISVSKVKSYTAEIIEVNGIFIPIGRGYRDIIEKL
ncbi:MAG: LytR/AlgR family response regulator transcription factor [Chitinophagaceae bacterium]